MPSMPIRRGDEPKNRMADQHTDRQRSISGSGRNSFFGNAAERRHPAQEEGVSWDGCDDPAVRATAFLQRPDVAYDRSLRAPPARVTENWRGAEGYAVHGVASAPLYGRAA